MSKKYSEEFKRLGLNIQYYRKLNGLTQLQLAEIVNISRTHISNIEAPNVDATISLELLLDIAKALNISVSQLLNFEK